MSTGLTKYVEPSTERSLRILKIEAEQILASGLAPDAIKKSKTPEADLILVGLTGLALGVPNLAMATRNIFPIDGRTALSAVLTMGVAEVRAGAVWGQGELSSTRCTVWGRRANWPASRPDSVVTYELEDAMRAGLLDVTWTLWKKAQSGSNYPAERWMERGWDHDSDQWVDNRANWPAWAKAENRDAKRSMKDNWYKHRKAMLLARATKLLATSLGGAALVGLTLPIAWEVDGDELLGPDVAAPGEVDGRFVPDGDDDQAPEDDDPVVSDAWRRWWFGGPAKDAGIEGDELRHAVVHFATDGRVSSLSAVRNSERDAVKAVTERVGRGDLVLGFTDDGTPTLHARPAEVA